MEPKPLDFGLFCVACGEVAGRRDLSCKACGELLEVRVNPRPLAGDAMRELFAKRWARRELPAGSGVWRYAEVVHLGCSPSRQVSMAEGNTPLYAHVLLSAYTGVDKLVVKHEGANPTGSFKDRGMCVGVSEALLSGAKAVACASTGNTSASMAAYAAQAGLAAVVLIPEGKIALGKLAQSLAYGAKVVQVRGNFDQALDVLRKGADELGLYLLNSLNPWRIEGQKTIVFEMLQQRDWRAPDWIVVPAGNLGNTSAFGKALLEAREWGLIDRLPRLAAVQAAGSAPFYRMWRDKAAELRPEPKPETIATAIRIGSPVSWRKALRVIRETNGVVAQVDDTEIMDAKTQVDAAGIGCEPASAASVAGVRRLVGEGVIRCGDDVVCVLTGHVLKDPDAVIDYHTGEPKGYKAERPNRPVKIEPTVEALGRVVSFTGFTAP